MSIYTRGVFKNVYCEGHKQNNSIQSMHFNLHFLQWSCFEVYCNRNEKKTHKLLFNYIKVLM